MATTVETILKVSLPLIRSAAFRMRQDHFRFTDCKTFADGTFADSGVRSIEKVYLTSLEDESYVLSQKEGTEFYQRDFSDIPRIGKELGIFVLEEECKMVLEVAKASLSVNLPFSEGKEDSRALRASSDLKMLRDSYAHRVIEREKAFLARYSDELGSRKSQSGTPGSKVGTEA